MNQLQAHEFANLFPMMGEADLSKLATSIRENGLRDPIIIFENQILDGRNRYKACQEIGVTPSTKKFEGDDPLQFVLDHNLHRRHLTESQRAMVAAGLAKLRHGQKPDASIEASAVDNQTQLKAAKDLSVGRSSVQRARRIQDSGSDKLNEAVTKGEISVNAGAKISSLSSIEQDELVEAGPVAVKAKAKELSEAKKEPNEPDPKPINASRLKVVQEIGIGVALTAINTLKRINKNDTQRVEALQRVIDHCQGRLNNNL